MYKEVFDTEVLNNLKSDTLGIITELKIENTASKYG